jgi:hydrophobic/amphiphilic exporter-1 (mainly G- bacteria), HAE1 family
MQWLAEICVHRPVFATVLMLFLTVVGGFSFFTLGVDRFPRIELPTVTVQTSIMGAAPQEVESDVTDVIEAAVNTVPGIEELRSTSSRGRSNVTITFNLDKNPDIAAQEVRDKVGAIINRLPDSADPPVVQKSDPDSQPIIQWSVSAPTNDRVALTTLVENLIQKNIESADGVGEVFMFGARRRQVKILLNPDRLRAYGISITEVSSAVRNQNQELPGGNLIEGARTFGVRTMSKLTDVDQFSEIVVATRNGVPIKLKDIARVEGQGGADAMFAATLNGVSSVSIGVRKQPGANTIEVINNVKKRMENLKPNLPPDMQVAVIRDQSEFIQNSLTAIQEHLLLGGLFAAIVVFLFLWNFRSTIIAALAIPISIIASFALIAAFGYSLNQMTMLALTLMVGVVIDDAIVVLENIYRFVEEKGMHPVQAAIEGTREIGLAVLATTLSLLAVFIPVGFMTGIVGRFMSSFGITASAAIAVSLIVSFTLTPMLASRWIKPKKKVAENESSSGDQEPSEEKPKAHSKDSWVWNKVDRGYTTMLKTAMRFRWAVVLICVLTVASTVPIYNAVGMAFLPDEDESLFQVNFRGPNGMALAETQGRLETIARDIRENLPGVQNTLVLAGFGRGAGPNNGFVNVSLKPISERKESQADLIEMTREIVKPYSGKGVQVNVSASSSIAGSLGLGRGGTGIGFYIAGPDIARLNLYAAQLVEKMKTDPIFKDPDSSIERGNPEIRTVIDREKAADLGVQAGTVAQAVNALIAGQRVSTFSEGSEQYDVVIQADERFRRDRKDLSQFIVPSQFGGYVDLEQLARIEESVGPSTISRINRQRQVSISAGLPPNASESDALAKIQAFAKELDLPPGYVTGVTGQSKQLNDAYDAFMLAFLLSFIFMYLILAAQFESFIHPVTILLTLPLSIPFALLSTLIAGQTLNIFSALGILLLFGIVKKNAILQIDHTNHLRKKGLNRYEAIIQANRDRLRPILMTTISLVAGMIPLTLGAGAGAATNRSIGILVVGGQSLCLLLTLLAVPVFYSLFDDAQESLIVKSVGERFGWLTRFTRPITAGIADVASLYTRRKDDDVEDLSDKGEDK